MGFNPFEEKGTPIEKQFVSWKEMAMLSPYDPQKVDPYTRARGILMNGIETEAVLFYHSFHRHTDDMDLRRKLALVRRIEQQEQKMVNWSIPATESTLEVTIGYEQLAVDLTAALAKRETDPKVKAALDFALVEDFDHLYRYANLLALTEPKKAEGIVNGYTEIMPGRPTAVEHSHPMDTVRLFGDKGKMSVQTKMNVLTIVAAEQQTMNYYMNVGNRINDKTGRSLYQEIGMIEEQHVTHYGSLLDPRASWFEMAVDHEYNECYLYYSCLTSEKDPAMKAVWQKCLDYEITHLQMAREMMKQYEKKDPVELFPKEMPEPTVLEPAKHYVRRVIADQINLTADMTDIVPFEKAQNKERYDQTQSMLNCDEVIPSQMVINSAIQKFNQDYRLETEGPHPIEMLRNRSMAPSREEILQRELMATR